MSKGINVRYQPTKPAKENPPKTATPKGGKRGRPPAASRLQDASQQQPELPQDLNDELSFEDQSTPKDGIHPPAPGAKRGRPSRATANDKQQPTPRRAGRASRTTKGARKDDELADESVDTPGSSKVGKRRTGRVNDGHSSPAVGAATEKPAEIAPKKKRGRPAKADNPEPQAEEPPAKRKRGRPSLQKAPPGPEAAPLQESNSRGNKGKRKAPPAQEDQATEVEAEPPAKKSRQRKPATEEPSVPTPEPSRPRGRPKTSTVPAPSSSTKKPKEKPSPKKRRRTQDAPAESSAPEPPSRRKSDTTTSEPPAPAIKCRHISDKPTTITESSIRETWSPLTAPSIPLATSHLDLASRPVLQKLPTNLKRQNHAADVLRKVSNIIARRLRSFPLPPALNRGPQKRGPRGSRPIDPRDDELNPEHVLDAVKSLQRSLDTLLDSRRLLEMERDRQQAALDKEYNELERLEGNARSEVRGLREQLRKAHPLVPEPPPQGTKTQDDVGVRPVVDDGPGDVLFRDMDAVELPGLDVQLANHMESLRANLGQVDGVVPEILQSRAALRALLANYLGAEQLEHVVLG